MKALWGVFAAVLVSFPNPLVALTIDCVPDRGCQEGEEVGEECCEQPPCEFFYRLMNFKWMVRAYLSDKVMDAVVKEDDQYTIVLMDEYFEQRLSFDDCPEHRLALDSPPAFRSDSSCEMVVYSSPDALDGQPLSSLQQVLDKTLTCKEWVADELDFGHELVRECLAPDGGRYHYWSTNLRRWEFQLWKMEAHLTDYCRLCSCSPAAELARWIVKHANPPLKDPPNKKRPPKKTPKRAAQKSR